eukprot:582458-Hanusia_phi.AAC.1
MIQPRRTGCHGHTGTAGSPGTAADPPSRSPDALKLRSHLVPLYRLSHGRAARVRPRGRPGGGSLVRSGSQSRFKVRVVVGLGGGGTPSQ